MRVRLQLKFSEFKFDEMEIHQNVEKEKEKKEMGIFVSSGRIHWDFIASKKEACTA